MKTTLDALGTLATMVSRDNPMGRDQIVLTYSEDFEPWGRASETWETIWRLKLPYVPFFWMSGERWSKGTAGKLGMTFEGHTPEQCIQGALDFMRWLGVSK